MTRQWCIDSLKCIQLFDKVTALGLSAITINPFNYKLVSPDYAVKVMTCKTSLIHVYLHFYGFHTKTL